VTISFVDTYPRNRARLASIGSELISEETMRFMAKEISVIARTNGMQTVSCAETIDLSDCGVTHGSCIDAELLSRIGGIPLNATKDPNQRPACGCAPSVDIGAYNTCPNGCLYCYANYSPAFLKTNLAQQDDASPVLCSQITETDKITPRKSSSLKETQIRMNL
jgi:hypothetical protein